MTTLDLHRQATRSVSAPPALLVVVSPTRSARRLLDEIDRLGWHAIVVSQPLEMIVHLQSRSFAIAAIIAPECETHFNTREMFRFAREAFPDVRLVAYCLPQVAPAPGLSATELDGVLRLPASLHRLRSALGAPDGSDARPAAPRGGEADGRTVEQLLGSWHASSDGEAFDQLDRRYRQSILRAAEKRGHSAADADDIAQEALLSAFLSRPPQSSPDALFSGLTTAACVALERGHSRRERLSAAVAQQGRTHRRGMESRARPDVRLLAGEMATRARAAVDRLPGQCQRPFFLCAVDNLTARDAGARLDMFPSTVSMWLRRARELIASDLSSPLRAPAPNSRTTKQGL